MYMYIISEVNKFIFDKIFHNYIIIIELLKSRYNHIIFSSL